MRRGWSVVVAGALLAGLLSTLVQPSPAADAYWTAPIGGNRYGDVVTSTVPQVATPIASVAERNRVTVSWPATTLAGGTRVSGYVVTRTPVGGGAAVSATGGCAGLVATTSCVEGGVPDGRWTYAVAARIGTSWVGPASAASGVVIADTVAPTMAFAIQVTSGVATMRGTTIWYRGAGNGALHVVTTVTDGLSGPGSASTGALAGASTGWSHVPTNVSTPARGPYVSAPFTWAPGTSTAPTSDIVGFDVAGNQTSARVQLRDDSVGPTGGTIAYATGTQRTTSSSAAIALTLGTPTDEGSGLASARLEQSTSPMQGDVCPSWSAWTLVQDRPGTSVTTSAAVSTCVQYRYVTRDVLGNETIATGGIVKVKPPYSAVVRGTSGLLHQYRFDGAGTAIMADTPTGTNSGQNSSQTATVPAPGVGAIAGDASTSASFDGVDDHVRITRSSTGASFSVELWFRSTQGLTHGTSGHWYHGAGLVDAEMPGVQNDWGISLAADGRVLAGVGNPDTTIRSQAGLNDGRWHHVVMTRDQSSGVVTLYVDGASVASYTAAAANRQTLGASSFIDIGRLQTAIGYFQGNIDEVALYNTVLTPTQVAEHHAAAL